MSSHLALMVVLLLVFSGKFIVSRDHKNNNDSKFLNQNKTNVTNSIFFAIGEASAAGVITLYMR